MLQKVFMLLFFVVGSQAVQREILTMSSNVTTAKVGQPFTLKCELENNHKRETKEYRLEFWYSVNGLLAVFVFYVPLTKDDTAFTFQANFNAKNQQYISALQPLMYKNNSIYELSVTAKTNFTTSFYCEKRVDGISQRSNYLQLAVTDPKTPAKPVAPKITAVTNATSIKAGEPFTMRCDLNSDFQFEHDHYGLMFAYRINGVICEYDLPKTINDNKKVPHFDTYITKLDQQYITKVSSIRNNLSSFEVLITPNSSASFGTDFYCDLYKKDQTGHDSRTWTQVLLATSNAIPISVKALPQPQLNLNLSNLNTPQYNLSHPFTLSCSIDHFDATGKRYSVQYFSSRDGLIASFDVNASGKSFFSAGVYEKFSAHLGPRSTFPNFDLVITEKVDRKLSYWCELTVPDQHRIFKSTVWKPAGPFLDFTSAKNKDLSLIGKCSIDGFEEHAKIEYQVSFYSDLGENKTSNFLAYFLVKPNQTTEFVHELHHAPWSSIAANVASGSVAYPSFEIVSKIDGRLSGNNTWWCLLSIGNPRQPNYRVIKSSVQELV